MTVLFRLKRQHWIWSSAPPQNCRTACRNGFCSGFKRKRQAWLQNTCREVREAYVFAEQSDTNLPFESVGQNWHLAGTGQVLQPVGVATCTSMSTLIFFDPSSNTQNVSFTHRLYENILPSTPSTRGKGLLITLGTLQGISAARSSCVQHQKTWRQHKWIL